MNNYNAKILQKCPYCDFEDNTKESAVCEICGTSLVKQKKNTFKHQKKFIKKTQLFVFPRINSIVPSKLSQSATSQLGITVIFFLAFVSIGTPIFAIKTFALHDSVKYNTLLATYRDSHQKRSHLAKPNSANSLWASKSENQKQEDIKSYSTISDVVNVPQGIFNFGGSICFAALVREGFHEEITKIHPQFQLRYVEPIANPGCIVEIEMLLGKKLSFAQNAQPLTDKEHQLARNRGFTLESIPVALDGVVVYVNKSLKIKSLSLVQLRDIFRGKIKSWQEVGGVDLPITVISLDPSSNNDLQLVMETENGGDHSFLEQEFKIVRDYTTAIREVAETPGAISLGSTAILQKQSLIKPIAIASTEKSIPVSALLADGKVNLQTFELNSYPLTRRLFIVIRRDGTVEEKAGVAYTNFLISQQGQSILKKAGFVPIYPEN